MEGVGSRLGRASSRYGPAPVFSGPVRKWKKQWVSYQNNNSQTKNGNGNNNHTLLLCRWTPLPSTYSDMPEEPPKRKLRYTPIVVLEERKKGAAKKVDNEAKTIKMNQSTASATSKSDDIFEKPIIDDASTEETKGESHSNKSQLDLDLCLKGHDDDHDLESENNEVELGRESSG
ncbi:unnamed protein product [Ilex paraguariensis]|uniref:Uncharacterized protein n=1 Tax=Ilex paraguariensis TaxID=185542 RepID=A0ABC8T3D8_9AQUA